MVKIEVSRLKHTHDLNSFCGFTMEGDGSGLYDLCHESLKGDDIHLQHTTIYEIRQTVQDGINSEQTFGSQLIFRTGILRHMTDDA